MAAARANNLERLSFSLIKLDTLFLRRALSKPRVQGSLQGVTRAAKPPGHCAIDEPPARRRRKLLAPVRSRGRRVRRGRARAPKEGGRIGHAAAQVLRLAVSPLCRCCAIFGGRQRGRQRRQRRQQQQQQQGTRSQRSEWLRALWHPRGACRARPAPRRGRCRLRRCVLALLAVLVLAARPGGASEGVRMPSAHRIAAGQVPAAQTGGRCTSATRGGRSIAQRRSRGPGLFGFFPLFSRPVVCASCSCASTCAPRRMRRGLCARAGSRLLFWFFLPLCFRREASSADCRVHNAGTVREQVRQRASSGGAPRGFLTFRSSVRSPAAAAAMSIVKEGWVIKCGGSIKTWKKRWCAAARAQVVGSPLGVPQARAAGEHAVLL